MDFSLSPRAQDLRDQVRHFIDNHIMPVEEAVLPELLLSKHGGDWGQWSVLPQVEALKEKARELGLWNLFLPDAEFGAGLSVSEYAVLAEQMGRSHFAPEVFNCNAPDTGNMEVLWKYGSEAQKARWLTPLLNAEIRSVFFMTEPDVASSDATNMEATIAVDGDELVLNGKKWWSTGVGDPRCEVGVFMGLSNPDAARHSRHSMVLVPMNTPGVTIKRMLPVFGGFDEPIGHGEVWFDNVRVPKDNLILGLGRGFEIAQGRLGPGRIHHCMRAIGAAERALELMIKRGQSRQAFGKPLIKLGANPERVADLRIAIDQARLLTQYAAWKIDQVGAMAALSEISAIKVVAPNVLQNVVDEAIQLYGGAGLSNDTPLASMFAMARVLRIADGPDAVHRNLIARLEFAKYNTP
ncbi:MULTISPECIES: acyl-CoA dehydrogenase family protein [Spongiibacter]|jgi:alkylation response protein AidB-like acyl-CoA dehydrogenase|uniref:acyl-CoA dehydrogenase family protein n=1 Tax=Spongiibacter TaxID=630749 RepID=UPI0003FE8658|nr:MULTISPECIES: acyl-CoA dehydrogenase family protein [Spongiibacter]MAK42538.1 acyl-CoA dehydrogenase [Spongiibacter sp.]MEE2652652.1 acyl-CoA dehydrogenase family protein [Pseudomonadota bacterium]|tara:strand:- start:18401 stop:19627 length:1227 start_codon:yes stop_codon:yes gene_type:complete